MSTKDEFEPDHPPSSGRETPFPAPRRDVGWQSRAPPSAPAIKIPESFNLSMTFAGV